MPLRYPQIRVILSSGGAGGKIRFVTKTFEGVVGGLGFNAEIEDRRQKVAFHTLRHTFASWLAIQVTPILTIKELMGHKSLAMTERYAHLIPHVKREAIGILEMSFNGGNRQNINTTNLEEQGLNS